MISRIKADELVLLRHPERDDSEGDIYRVICPVYAKSEWLLARTPIHPLDPDRLSVDVIKSLKLQIWRESESLIEQRFSNGSLKAFECELAGPHRLTRDALSDVAKAEERARVAIMAPFLEPPELIKHFSANVDFGSMIAGVCGKTPADYADEDKIEKVPGKPTLYYWLKLLITYGFSARSLTPWRFNSGAPGVLRPYGDDLPEPKKRPGRRSATERLGLGEAPTQFIAENERERIVSLYKTFSGPGHSEHEIYIRILTECYAEKVTSKNGEILPVLAERGGYPNFEQFKYVVRIGLNRLRRKFMRTTRNHIEKTMRGLMATARVGVLGPGHKYMIDSTVADCYLRSTLDRNLFVGRAIVYWLIDVWSTAVVGYYACLSAPSWRNAGCAIFSTVADPELVSEMYGYDRSTGLNPRPTLCAALAADRGEYLSLGGHASAKDLGFAMEHNPSYRADLRGGGERFNRIQKDHAFGFLPGAFDARRKELECAPDCRASTMVLSEFSQYLGNLAREHNSTAVREKLSFAEMILNGYELTPAGLWAWGHDQGIGYQAAQKSTTQLARALLPRTEVSWQRNGPHIGPLHYEAHGLEELTAQARNCGTFSRDGYILPAALGCALLDCGGDQLELREMSPQQLISQECSWFDLEDTLVLNQLQRPDQAHLANQRHIEFRARNQELKDGATEATMAASLDRRDLRRLEDSMHTELQAQRGSQQQEPSGTSAATDDDNSALDDLILECLGEG